MRKSIFHVADPNIDHGGKFIESSQSTALNCTFTNERSGVPTLYILKSKVERLGVLLSALEKMFMSENSPKEESDSLKVFLQSLIIQQPLTFEEIEEVARSYEILQLPGNDPMWRIPRAQYQPTEDASCESEEDSFGGVYYVIDTWPSVEETEQSKSNQENTGLKSWPPRAAVQPRDSYPIQHPLTSLQLQQKYTLQMRDRMKDTVGAKEYEDIKNKFNLEGREPLTDKLRNIPFVAKPPEHQSRFFDMPTAVKKHVQPESTSHHDPVASAQACEATEDWPTLPPSKKPCLGQARLSDFPDTMLVQRELESQEHTVDRNVDMHLDTKTRSVYSPRCKGFFNEAILDSQIGLVPLTELVQSVQPSNSMPIVPLLSSNDLQRVGRWGEEFVFTLLRNSRQFPDGGQIQAITWMNESSESGLPYDLTIEVDTSVTQERQTYFVDVKATTGKEKAVAAASWKELKFAEDNSDSYCIFRVYEAGTSTAKVSFIKNLIAYFENNQTRFFFNL